MSSTRRLSCFFLLLIGSAAARGQLTPIADVNDIQAGTGHACAISTGGGLRCWGDNAHGQLGRGTYALATTPVDVSGLSSGVAAVALGGRHTCALLATDEVRCWGDNDNGQLGRGDLIDSPLPVSVTGLPGTPVALAAGDAHTCAMLSNGGVSCWGANAQTQLGNGVGADVPSPAVVGGLNSTTAITSFGNHTCVLVGGGAIKCWGANGGGQLGDGTATSTGFPVDVLSAPMGAPVTGYVAVAAGSVHTCAINGSGAVSCWGDNTPGALGDGTTTNRSTPGPVSGLTSGVQGIDAGLGATCATLSGGVAKCWGDNSFGQVGDGTAGDMVTGASNGSRLVPTTVAVSEFAHQMAVGDQFACARTLTSVECWGYNRFHALGDGRGGTTLAPRANENVVDLDGATRVTARGDLACALKSTGTVRCWGGNHFGGIGDGTIVPRTTSIAVPGVAGVLKIAVGTHHGCAVLGGGGLQCWGFNQLGSLGIGTLVDALSPVSVLDPAGASPLTGAVSVAAGGSHTCALRSDTGVLCWGNRSFGRIGDGQGGPPQTLPVQVLDAPGGSPLLGFASITSGQNHLCGLTTSGGVRCWGRNDNGRLGDGTDTHRGTPVTVLDNTGLAPLSNIAAVVAGADSTCALTTGGTVKCWGRNSTGELGNGGLTDSFLPVDVAGLPPGVNEIALGFRHACARNGGQVRCWGLNEDGQLGDGTDVSRTQPVLVNGITTAASVAASYGSTCVTDVSGEVFCWGLDDLGQRGVGNRNFALPARVRVEPAPRQVEPVTPAADNASLAPQSDAQGRYIVFQSSATNLIGSDGNGGSDVYVVDRETGDVVRASVNNDGSESGGGAIEPSVTADGGAIAFVAPDASITKVLGESKAAADKRIKAGTSAIFLRNLVTGTTQRLGVALPTTANSKPRLAAGGKAIVYTGINTDPAQGAVGQQNVYRIPLQEVGDALMPQATECVSCQARNVMGVASGNADGESGNAVVSADGRYVVFETKALNTVVGAPAPCPNAQVMLRDMLIGFTQRLSPPPGIAPVNCGTTGSTAPSIDWPALNITFTSDSAIKPGTVPGIKSTFGGSVGSVAFERLSESDDGSNPDGGSDQPVLSGDGETVVFVSEATNLDPSFADTNAAGDVYAIRRSGGRFTGGRAQRLSRTVTGAEANAPANRPALNYNATLLLFDSAASNLVPADANAQVDVFARVVPANAEIVFSAGFE